MRAGRGQRPQSCGGAAEQQSAPWQFPLGAGFATVRGWVRRALVPGAHLEDDDGATLLALPVPEGWPWDMPEPPSST